MTATSSITKFRLTFDVLLVAVFAATAYQSLGFSDLARIFPLWVSLAATVLAVANVVADVVRWRRAGTAIGADTAETAALVEGGDTRRMLIRSFRYLGWFLGYALLIALFGLLVGTIGFVGAFLAVEARARIWFILAGVAATAAALIGLSYAMNLQWPHHLIYFT